MTATDSGVETKTGIEVPDAYTNGESHHDDDAEPQANSSHSYDDSGASWSPSGAAGYANIVADLGATSYDVDISSRPIGQASSAKTQFEFSSNAGSRADADFDADPSFDLKQHVEEHQHLLEDLDTHRRAVERANTFARVNGLVHIPPIKPLANVVSLAQYQTGFRNQGSRGTCYAFASCAAIEAAYKRKYGVDLDLSEQFAFHINKAGELYSDYTTTTSPHENNSSYWGFQGGSDIVDKLARAAIPTEAAAPYLDGPAMTQLLQATPAAGTLDPNTATQEQLDAFEFLQGHIPTRARQSASYRVTASLPYLRTRLHSRSSRSLPAGTRWWPTYPATAS